MEDTIAAISSAISASGIGIVRISGSEALYVADRIYQSKGGRKKLSEVPTHTIHYGYVHDEKEIIDEVLMMVMRGPKTYTGEDTVEIDCHGGIYAMRRVLETVLKNGARIAEPGEFTKRAFLNGRIDLSQAEAVMDVIQAKNEYALKSSMEQLRGSVKKAIQEIRSQILYQIAYIESALDDPEHISLEGYTKELSEIIDNEIYAVEKLYNSASDGKVISEGIRTVILGKPNAGKSSLLNVLLGENRAIVTEVAGTTRDVLEESVHLGNLILRIIDTAGIRQTEDVVEKIGVSRAWEKAEDADLILYVVDSSVPLDDNDEEIISMISNPEKKAIVLYNKSDLSPIVSMKELEEKTGKKVLVISALEETGIENLTEEIKEMFLSGEIIFQDEIYITNARHKKALEDALNSLYMVNKSIQDGLPEDFYSIDLMDAYASLGRIIGESVGEDLVNEIFGKFCMGK